ncbi:MAG: globin domain-containing protein [Methylococcaceae bacterium]
MKIQNRLLVKECIDELNPHIEKLSQNFYKELFQLDVHLEKVFSGNVAFLNRKFINMLATLKNVKHLEAISDSVAKMGERHAERYGAEIKHFPTVKQALMIVLKQHLKERFDEPLETAWQEVFDEVSAIMTKAIAEMDLSNSTELRIEEEDSHLFNDIGGEEIIFEVHQRFYDAIFVEPWLEKFFYGKSKEALVYKQSLFMIAAFNGPNNYKGDTPAFAHMHMLITEEMSAIREILLRNAILAQGLSESIAERWLKVDRSFRIAIEKKSVEECVLKCRGQIPIVAKKPEGYIAPKPL